MCQQRLPGAQYRPDWWPRMRSRGADHEGPESVQGGEILFWGQWLLDSHLLKIRFPQKEVCYKLLLIWDLNVSIFHNNSVHLTGDKDSHTLPLVFREFNREVVGLGSLGDWAGSRRPTGGDVTSGREGRSMWLVLRPATSLALESVAHQTPFSIPGSTYPQSPKEFPFSWTKSHSDSVKGVTPFLLQTGKKNALVVPFNHLRHFMFLKYKVSHFYLIVCIMAPEF